MDLYELFEACENLQLITLEVTVISGFESTAASEIKEKVPLLYDLCKTRGRVFISTSGVCVRQILMLRSVDRVYLIASTGRDINLSNDKVSALDSIEKLIESPNWTKVIDIWRSASEFKGNCFPSKQEHLEASRWEATLKRKVEDLWREKEMTQDSEKSISNKEECAKVNGAHSYKDKRKELKENIMRKADQKAMYKDSDERLDEEKVLKFRMTCYRSGNHCFTSQEVAHSLGGKLQEKFNWVVDLVNHDIEVVTNIRENKVYLGVLLTPESLHRRNIRNFGPTTLRATVCYNLLRLASPKPGEIIMDPLCGGGSIPIEGALAYSGCYNIAGDIHPIAVSRTFENVQFLKNGRTGYVDLLHWDVTNLPLRDACVDVLVTDLPFGKRSGSKHNNQTLYQKAMLEMGRCIVPSGRVVCLTWDKTNLTRTLRSYGALWSILRTLTINLGGLQATVYVLKRTSESLVLFLAKMQKKKRNKKWLNSA